MDAKSIVSFLQANKSAVKCSQTDITATIQHAYLNLDFNPHKSRDQSKAFQITHMARDSKFQYRSRNVYWDGLSWWAKSPDSAIMVVEGYQNLKGWVEATANDTIDLLETRDITLVWALNVLSRRKDSERPRKYAVRDIIAQLCLQLLVHNQALHSEYYIEKCLEKSEQAVTDIEWLNLLCDCIAGLQEIYVIIDLDVICPVDSNPSSLPVRFKSLLEELPSRSVHGLVKAIFFTCNSTFEPNILSDTELIKLPYEAMNNLRLGSTFPLGSSRKASPTGTDWLSYIGQRSHKGVSQDTDSLHEEAQGLSRPGITDHSNEMPSQSAFKIVIICALPIEADAVQALFDRHWDEEGFYQRKALGDTNSYTAGLLGHHNVVIAHMPRMGIMSAAAVATNCRNSFPSIRLALVVGVCGGVPFPQNRQEIVLGDIVVSDSAVQYDFGRRVSGAFYAKEDILDVLGRPNIEISSFLSKMQGLRRQSDLNTKISKYLELLRLCGSVTAHYPGADKDILFDATCCHPNQLLSCDEAGCDGRTIRRHRLQSVECQPMVHFGRIGSGNTVLKDGEERDRMSMEKRVIAFEMEGAGVWDVFPCLVIKGVCDYADSHKNKQWQSFAAATAACCTKALLDSWIFQKDVEIS